MAKSAASATPVAAVAPSSSSVGRWIFATALALIALLVATAVVATGLPAVRAHGRVVAEHQVDLELAGAAVLVGILAAWLLAGLTR